MHINAQLISNWLTFSSSFDFVSFGRCKTQKAPTLSLFNIRKTLNITILDPLERGKKKKITHTNSFQEVRVSWIWTSSYLNLPMWDLQLGRGQIRSNLNFNLKNPLFSYPLSNCQHFSCWQWASVIGIGQTLPTTKESLSSKTLIPLINKIRKGSQNYAVAL